MDGDLVLDLYVEHERICDITAAGSFHGSLLPRLDVGGRQVWPMLVDMHAHLDKGQVIPRVHPDGAIVTGARRTADDRRHWSEADLRKRMEFALRCAYAHGVSAIRTHIDSNHALTERVWGVWRELRHTWSGRVDLQGVGSAPLELFHGETGARLANLVAESGGVLGGVTDAIGASWQDSSGIQAHLDRFLQLAAERSLDVDLHVDQSADTSAFTLPESAEAVLRNGFRGRVVCGHCVNLSLQPDDVARDAIRRCADAGLAFVTLPTPMMYLMDRSPGRTPRWRGVTAVHELQAAGLQVAIGGDNCRDAWFPYGDHDMVDTFRQGVRVLQLDEPISQTPGMVGPIPAAIIGASGHGSMAVGAPARLIVFSARSLNELMCRPQSDRIVIDRGRVVDGNLPDYAELD